MYSSTAVVCIIPDTAVRTHVSRGFALLSGVCCPSLLSSLKLDNLRVFFVWVWAFSRDDRVVGFVAAFVLSRERKGIDAYLYTPRTDDHD